LGRHPILLDNNSQPKAQQGCTLPEKLVMKNAKCRDIFLWVRIRSSEPGGNLDKLPPTGSLGQNPGWGTKSDAGARGGVRMDAGTM